MTDRTRTDALALLLAADRHLHDTGRLHGPGTELQQAYLQRNAVIGIAINAGVTPHDIRTATDDLKTARRLINSTEEQSS